MQAISACIQTGKYLDTRHASDRKNERHISRPELIYVLKNGYHEKKKDRFETLYHSWNYSINGKTLDKRNLRIIVSFDEASLLIITAIDLDI